MAVMTNPRQTHQEGRGIVTSLEDSTSKLESDGREQDEGRKQEDGTGAR